MRNILLKQKTGIKIMRTLVTIFLLFCTSVGYASEVKINCNGYVFIIDTNKKRMKADGGLWRQTIHWDSEYIVTINAKDNMAFNYAGDFFQLSTYVLNRKDLILIGTLIDRNNFTDLKFLPNKKPTSSVNRCVRGF